MRLMTLKYLGDDSCVFENEPMNTLAAEHQIAAFQHPGFWQCMDTYREQQLLTNLWTSGQAPWTARWRPGATGAPGVRSGGR